MMTMTDDRRRSGDLSPPADERLESPLTDDAMDLDALQRALSEQFGYSVDIDLYVRLVTDPEQWDLPRFKAVMAGPDPDNPVVRGQTISVWRMNTARNGGQSGPNALPPEDGKVGQSPWWHAGGLRRDMIEKGWMRPDGVPCKPLPPGKAPKPRTG